MKVGDIITKAIEADLFFGDTDTLRDACINNDLDYVKGYYIEVEGKAKFKVDIMPSYLSCMMYGDNSSGFVVSRDIKELQDSYHYSIVASDRELKHALKKAGYIYDAASKSMVKGVK